MHKTYKEMLDRLKGCGNRIYASDPERDAAMLDEMLNTLYLMLAKMAEEEAKYQVEMD